jgi:hypothetical protein
MSDSLTIPLESQSSSVAVNKPIFVMQFALAQLAWLGVNSLGRVRPQVVEGKLQPWIRKEGSEYYPAYPNDTLTAYSCLYAHDNEKFADNNVWASRTVSVIVCVDLEKLGQKDTEPLKLDVWRALRELSCITSMSSVDQTPGGYSGVFPGFDVSGLDDRFMTYPFGAFRVECTVHYADLCH